MADDPRIEHWLEEARKIFESLNTDEYHLVIKPIGEGKTQIFIYLAGMIVDALNCDVNIIVPTITARDELCKRLKKEGIPFMVHPATLDMCRQYKIYIDKKKESPGKELPTGISQTTLDDEVFLVEECMIGFIPMSKFKIILETKTLNPTLCKYLNCTYCTRDYDRSGLAEIRYWDMDELYNYNEGGCPHLIYFDACEAMREIPHVNVFTYQKIIETIVEGVKLDERFSAPITLVDEIDQVSKTRISRKYSLSLLRRTIDDAQNALQIILPKLEMGIADVFDILHRFLSIFSEKTISVEEIISDMMDIEAMEIVFCLPEKYRKIFKVELIKSFVNKEITPEQYNALSIWRHFIRDISRYYQNIFRLEVNPSEEDKELIFEYRGEQPYGIIESIKDMIPRVPGPLKDRIHLRGPMILKDIITNTTVFCYNSQPTTSKPTVNIIEEYLQTSHIIGATATPTLLDSDKEEHKSKKTSMPLRGLFGIEARPFFKENKMNPEKYYFKEDDFKKVLSAIIKDLPEATVAMVAAKKSDIKYIIDLGLGKILVINGPEARGVRTYRLNWCGFPFQLVLAVTQLPNAESVAEKLHQYLEDLLELHPETYLKDIDKLYDDAYRVLCESIAGDVIQASGRFHNSDVEVPVIILDSLSIYKFAGYGGISYLKKGELTPATDIVMKHAYQQWDVMNNIEKRAINLIKKAGDIGIPQSELVRLTYRMILYEVNDPQHEVIERLENLPHIKKIKKQRGWSYFYQNNLSKDYHNNGV